MLVSFFYIISPGPAVFLAIYNGIDSGSRAVMVFAVGNSLGLMLLSIASVSGLSALLLASPALFFLVKVCGAAYLIYLGARQLSSAKQAASHSAIPIDDVKRGLLSYFKEGFLIAVTNPKPIVFFAALFPQFLNADYAIAPQFIIMTLIFMFFSFVSLSVYGYLGKQARSFLAKPNNVQWFQRMSGILFIVMGVSILFVKS
ncbi:LysE family translocator [Marinagarivorans algicola]|uniref:LysE family translocator n=1 Tax=Marinagarivorans algicola TaxID=1513270 RepID=UPI00192E477E|nr:LysE family translocator [Marinagarivorans algicola]